VRVGRGVAAPRGRRSGPSGDAGLPDFFSSVGAPSDLPASLKRAKVGQRLGRGIDQLGSSTQSTRSVQEQLSADVLARLHAAPRGGQRRLQRCVLASWARCRSAAVLTRRTRHASVLSGVAGTGRLPWRPAPRSPQWRPCASCCSRRSRLLVRAQPMRARTPHCRVQPANHRLIADSYSAGAGVPAHRRGQRLLVERLRLQQRRRPALYVRHRLLGQPGIQMLWYVPPRAVWLVL